MNNKEEQAQDKHVHNWRHLATKRVPIDTVHGILGVGLQIVYEDKIVLTCDTCGETKTV